jgi:hypothetical protein
MKKTFTIIFLSLSALLILDSMDMSHALAMFLLAGIVPGTNIVLTADYMLMLFALLLGFVLARVCTAAFAILGSYKKSPKYQASKTL